MSKQGTIIKGDSKKHVLFDQGDTKDIITTILYANKFAPNYVTDFSKQIPGDTIEEKCAAIWNYVKENIPYNEDPEEVILKNGKVLKGIVTKDVPKGYLHIRIAKGDTRTVNYSDIQDRTAYQDVQSPGELYNNRKKTLGGTGKGGDCKSYSNFIHGCLTNLGIDHFERFISENAGDDLHHVYVCVPLNKSDYIVMDAVMNKFDQEVPFEKNTDIWCDMNRYNPDGSPAPGPAIGTTTLQQLPGTSSAWQQYKPLAVATGLLFLGIIFSD